MSSKERRKIRGDRKSAFIGTLAGWVMKILAYTLRLDVRDEYGITTPGKTPPPGIFLLWHSRFFCVPPARLKLGKPERKVITLTSASKDGDMVARAMAVFKFGAIRGSSSRRGVAALVGLKKSLEDGHDICVTPDGPRGPRYKVQAGAIKLAEANGAPIALIHVLFSSAWRLKTWDRFAIPKPFSRVQVTFSKPIPVPRDMDPETFEQKRLEIETMMINGTDDA